MTNQYMGRHLLSRWYMLRIIQFTNWPVFGSWFVSENSSGTRQCEWKPEGGLECRRRQNVVHRTCKCCCHEDVWKMYAVRYGRCGRWWIQQAKRVTAMGCIVVWKPGSGIWWSQELLESMRKAQGISTEEAMGTWCRDDFTRKKFNVNHHELFSLELDSPIPTVHQPEMFNTTPSSFLVAWWVQHCYVATLMAICRWRSLKRPRWKKMMAGSFAALMWRTSWHKKMLEALITVMKKAVKILWNISKKQLPAFLANG